VVEERADERGVQVGEIQRGGSLAQPLVGEGQQKPKRVAVGADGVIAGLALPDESVGEERLQGGGEGGHHSTDPIRPKRWATSCISSGVPVRYQYVFSGLV
jgi:hypothetical protein